MTAQNEYSVNNGAENAPGPCLKCGQQVRNPVPERWAERYPELRGLCRDCAFTWISTRYDEDHGTQQPGRQSEPVPAEGTGWLEAMEG